MLTSMKPILDHANKHNYAVMAMNICNMEMARGAIRAAEELHAPIIIQISPIPMAKHAHREEMVPLVSEMAQRASVPVCLNMDHGSDFQEIVACLRAGFTNVMFDGSALPYEENAKRTEMICALAHSQGCSVEAELGHVGQAAQVDDENADLLTDPAQAKDFVDRTGVDALAVAIGTAHGAYPKGKVPKLDFERLTELKSLLKMPLVLHGGSGAGAENIRRAVECGINKINVATDAFQAAKDAFLASYNADPSRSYLQLCIDTEEGVRRFVKDYLQNLGCCDRYCYGPAVITGNE